MTVEIFVFGSNLAGRHGKGAAADAYREHGAIYGNGRGLQGRSYAIPTKDYNMRTLGLHSIAGYVNEFIAYAQGRPDWVFNVTAIGTGLAGIEAAIIAPMFRYAPPNCRLPIEFSSIMMKPQN